ncbi:MAG TPA: MFS transporter [Candidatus Limnocylindria bacterium]|nr:MFS transporter [Candidatus Limnocylindria bacterium]
MTEGEERAAKATTAATAGGPDGTFLLQLVVVALATTAVNAIRPMVTYRALGLGAGPFEVGLVAAVFSVAPALLAVAVGRAIDRIGEVWFIRSALVSMTLGAALAVIVDSLWLLALSQTLTGLGHVTNLIAGQALVANRGGRSRRDHRYGYYSTMGSLGHLLGPLIGTTLVTRFALGPEPGAIAAANPQAPAFIAAGTLTLIAFGLAWFLPWLRPAHGAEAAEEERPGILTSAARVMRRPGMPFAMLVSMIVVSSVDLLIAYLPLYGEVRGISVSAIGVLLAIRAGASMLCRIFMGVLIDRLGRNKLLAISMSGAALGLALLPFVEDTVVLGALMVLIGLGLGIGQPMTMAWIANRSPRAERGTALGVRLTGNRTALIVVPILAGAVAGVTGVSLVFWLVAVLLFGGAIIGYRAPLDTEPPPRRADAGAA